MVRGLDRVAIGLLSAGHFSVDLCQGAVPAMLPFFVYDRHLSYAAAAGLVLAQTVSSSVIQPAFGYLTDRRPMPWLMPVGVAVAGLGIGAATQAPTYLLIWTAIAASGIGVAAYHPEGARYANYSSGQQRATGMSIFAVGGNGGFAAGPLLATPILLLFGLRGGWAIGLVPLAVAAVIALQLRRIDGHRPARLPVAAGTRDLLAERDDLPSFAKLGFVLLCRSVVFYGLNTFIPLYWIAGLHQSRGAGGVALSVLLLTGIAGTLAGGQLANRFGRKQVVLYATLLTAPLIVILLSTGNALLAGALLIPLALAMYAPSSVAVLMGQDYLASRIGMASGVTLGLGISVGGLVAPALGYVGDRAGLHAALILLAVIPILSAAVVATLPERRAGSR